MIPLSAKPSPRSKLLLGPPGGGGGCCNPAMSLAVSELREAEARTSERCAPPGSLPAPKRPARLACSRLRPLRSRGIVFPRPPPPPPPGVQHATLSRLRLPQLRVSSLLPSHPSPPCTPNKVERSSRAVESVPVEFGTSLRQRTAGVGGRTVRAGVWSQRMCGPRAAGRAVRAARGRARV